MGCVRVYECYGCDSVSVHICVPDHNNHSYSLAGFPPSLFSFYPAECINLMQKNQADRNKQINIRHLQRNKTDSTTRIRKSVHCRLWTRNLANRLVSIWGLCASFHAVSFYISPLASRSLTTPHLTASCKRRWHAGGRPEVMIRSLPSPQKHSRQLQPDKQ